MRGLMELCLWPPRGGGSGSGRDGSGDVAGGSGGVSGSSPAPSPQEQQERRESNSDRHQHPSMAVPPAACSDAAVAAALTAKRASKFPPSSTSTSTSSPTLSPSPPPPVSVAAVRLLRRMLSWDPGRGRLRRSCCGMRGLAAESERVGKNCKQKLTRFSGQAKNVEFLNVASFFELSLFCHFSPLSTEEEARSRFRFCRVAPA